jgi:hypothetical protein
MTYKKNKYTNWYYVIIKNAKKLNRSKKDGYFESHHIIPKSLGGSNDVENLVLLTAKEHYIVHLLLTKMVQSKNDLIKMSWALHRMVFSRTSTSRAYEHNRKKHSKFLKEVFHQERNKDLKYRQKLSDIVTEHWEDNDERRKEASKIFSESQAKRKKEDPNYYDEQIKRASKGGQAFKLKHSKRLEYKGAVYIGWGELQKATGVSKDLYKKYYLNGIDPEPRIGKNGPASKSNDIV